MKKIFTLATALLLIVSLAGCTKKEDENTVDNTDKQGEVNKDKETENTEIKNPYTSYATIDELKAALPYTINSHDDLFTDMTDVTYSLVANPNGNPVVHIEAYKETKDTLFTLLLRASDQFEGKTELAGIYDEIEDMGVDEEGKHNYQGDKVSLVTWDEEGIHYSLYTTEVALSSLK